MNYQSMFVIFFNEFWKYGPLQILGGALWAKSPEKSLEETCKS